VFNLLRGPILLDNVGKILRWAIHTETSALNP
jgi:hypothetical protein